MAANFAKGQPYAATIALMSGFTPTICIFRFKL
jgi:hypothetical protein